MGRPIRYLDLAIYLSGLYHEATHDLFRLNPDDGPTPPELFERFVHRHRTADLSSSRPPGSVPR